MNGPTFWNDQDKAKGVIAELKALNAVLKPFEELTVEDWDTTMATNLRSLYLMTREVLPAMRARKHGAIVNIASLAGRNGFVGGSAYTASKHAVLGFAKSLMLEVRKDNDFYRPTGLEAGIYEYQYNAVRVFDTEPDEYKVINITDTQVSVGDLYGAKTKELLAGRVMHILSPT